MVCTQDNEGVSMGTKTVGKTATRTSSSDDEDTEQRAHDTKLEGCWQETEGTWSDSGNYDWWCLLKSLQAGGYKVHVGFSKVDFRVVLLDSEEG